MPKPNYERLLARSMSHMMNLLVDTAVRTQGGTRSNTECLGCERTGVHKPELRCSCACHAARQFLSDLMKEMEAKDAA
jgi:hypothetical protein